MKLMGIDYGTKRVGVALSDDAASMAFPERTLANNAQLLESILALAKEKQVSGIVIGESKNYSGEDNPIMEEVRTLCDELRSAGMEVYLEPEFMTSQEAHRIQEKKDDASAAALILNSYLIRKQNGV